MNVENCIEAQYRELMECSEPNAEYADLYKAFTHPHLREILTTLHHDLILLFKRMNDRLPWISPKEKDISATMRHLLCWRAVPFTVMGKGQSW